MLLNLIVGVAVGLGQTGLLLVLHFAGVLRSQQGGRFLMLALAFHIVGLLWALGRHRAAASPEEGAPFSKLFGAGLMVSLIAGVVVAAGSLVFLEGIDPSYLDWIRESSRERLEALELPAEELEIQEQRLDQLTAAGYAMQGLMGTLMTGFFLSLTLAAFLRMRVIRKKP
ncbi:MAG: DUF4199 domain-containing protein [Acidobacteriota bacterium]